MDVDIDEAVLTTLADVNDAGGSPSQIVLPDATESRRSDADDVTRGTVDGGPVEQDNDKEIPSNFVPNVPSLSTERKPEALYLQEHDQREAVIERQRPTGLPITVPSDDAPDPVQSDRSERECKWPRNSLNLNALTFSSCGEILNG